jgi:hypothetical protein
MKAWNHRALVAFLLLSTVVAVAVQPAFATPSLTASTGSAVRPDNSAVSPFFTPIGSEMSAITFRGRFTIGRGISVKFRTAGGLASNWTCAEIDGSAFISTTHTRARITSLVFDACSVDQLIGASFTVTVRNVNVATPAFVHLRRQVSAESWDATFTLSIGQAIELSTVPPNSCRLTIREAQSVTVRDTDEGTQVEVSSSPTLIFKSEPGSTSFCPVPQAQLGIAEAAAVRYRHDTRSTETLFFRSTLTSNVNDSTRER